MAKWNGHTYVRALSILIFTILIYLTLAIQYLKSLPGTKDAGLLLYHLLSGHLQKLGMTKSHIFTILIYLTLAIQYLKSIPGTKDAGLLLYHLLSGHLQKLGMTKSHDDHGIFIWLYKKQTYLPLP
jgi:hypothetical protein